MVTGDARPGEPVPLAHGFRMPLTTPFEIEAALAGACSRLPGEVEVPRPIPLERSDARAASDPAVDWVSALPLRLARGDTTEAARLAARMADLIGPRAVPIGPRLGIRLDDADLDAAAAAIPEPPATPRALSSAAAAVGIRRRGIGDPLYATALLHARLVRCLGGGPGAWPPPSAAPGPPPPSAAPRAPLPGATPLSPAQPAPAPSRAATGWQPAQRAVLVAASAVPLALRRTHADASPHHVLAVLAELGPAGLAWHDRVDDALAPSERDHTLARAARRAVAMAWCGLGLTAPERF